MPRGGLLTVGPVESHKHPELGAGWRKSEPVWWVGTNPRGEEGLFSTLLVPGLNAQAVLEFCPLQGGPSEDVLSANQYRDAE